MTREALGLVGLVALVSESAMVNRVGIVKRGGMDPCGSRPA